MRDRGNNNTASQGNQPNDDTSMCVECGCAQVSPDEDYVFSCAVCKKPYHGKCLDFEDSSLYLIKAVFESITWTCNYCQFNAKTILTKGKASIQPQKLSKQNQITQTKLESLVNEVEQLRARISTLESLISGLSKPVVNNDQSTKINFPNDENTQPGTSSVQTTKLPINEIKSSVMKAVHGDLLNKKNRERNIVISGFKTNFYNRRQRSLRRSLCLAFRDQTDTRTDSLSQACTKASQ